MITMNICEESFNRGEDEDNPGYSNHEVDYYAWIPRTKQVETGTPNHRLSLRKNWVTKEYEFYRKYHRNTETTEIMLGSERGLMVIHKESGIEEVVFKSKNFQEALDFGNEEWNKWFSKFDPDYVREPDKPCTHGLIPSQTAMFCWILDDNQRS